MSNERAACLWVLLHYDHQDNGNLTLLAAALRSLRASRWFAVCICWALISAEKDKSTVILPHPRFTTRGYSLSYNLKQHLKPELELLVKRIKALHQYVKKHVDSSFTRLNGSKVTVLFLQSLDGLIFIGDRTCWRICELRVITVAYVLGSNTLFYTTVIFILSSDVYRENRGKAYH